MTNTQRDLLYWCLFLSVLLAAATWVGFKIRQARREALASCAQCPLNQLHLALNNYYEEYGTFPPAYVVDENGRPMHSWRALILPYADAMREYKEYDFSEPWDGPNNSKLANRMPNMFRSCTESESKSFTNFVVLSGPGTAFPDSQSTKLDDFKDGAENTILLTEIKDSKIPWLAPIDLPADEAVKAWGDPNQVGISCVPWRRPLVVFANRGTAFVLGKDLRPEALRALTTVAGGEADTQESLFDRKLIRRGYGIE
ncbi:MAG: DUF1559 domain-containing protein [Planctomycetaceae bacterium]